VVIESKNTKKNNFAIIGTGISGLSCGKLLNEKKIENTLFEKNNENGGLISCSIEDGSLFHKVGGHVFNTKFKNVNSWFWKYFDLKNEFSLADRNAAILIEGKLINYPIELNLSKLSSKHQKMIIFELIELSSSNFKKKGTSNFQNFEEFLTHNFGKTLYNLYFKKYNKKIWNKNLKDIPIDWLEGKLPMIKPEEIILKNISASKNDNMVHSSFYYPKINGSQFIVDRLSKGLNIKRSRVEKIDFYKNSILINDYYQYKNLIYTGDVRNLINLLDTRIINELEINNLLKEIELFESNGTTTVFCECDINDYSWIYIPDEEIKAHRIIMTGNFSKNNNSPNIPKKRITCTVEFTGKISLKIVNENLNKLPFNISLLKYNFCQSSYIIHNSKTRIKINELKSKLKSRNIFLCGRFAEWEYYNMDAAINSAMNICKIF